MADKTIGAQCYQTIRPRNFYPAGKYPMRLHRILYYDQEQDKILIFLTNNIKLEVKEMAILYKHRWYIELYSSGLNNI